MSGCLFYSFFFGPGCESVESHEYVEAKDAGLGVVVWSSGYCQEKAVGYEPEQEAGGVLSDDEDGASESQEDE